MLVYKINIMKNRIKRKKSYDLKKKRFIIDKPKKYIIKFVIRNK